MENKHLTQFRDTDLYLLDKLDDVDLLKVLSLNKHFLSLGTRFFEKRLKERYPFLVKFKPQRMNFTKYYLSQMHYIFKLKEEYDLDYIPSFSFNPKIIYYGLKYSQNVSEDIEHEKERYYYYVGETGDSNIINKYEKFLKTDNDKANLIRGIIKSGNLDLLKSMEARGYDQYRPSDLIYAAQSGNEDMIDYIVGKLKHIGDDVINEELVYGYAHMGDLKMVKYFDSHLEPNHYYQQILSFSSTLPVFLYFLEKLKRQEENEELHEDELEQDIGGSIHMGIIYNRLDVIKYIIDNRPDLIPDIQDIASFYGNYDVLDLLNLPNNNL